MECHYCGSRPESCVCGRLRMSLSHRLGSHYTADELFAFIKAVADNSARRMVCKNTVVWDKPKKRKRNA